MRQQRESGSHTYVRSAQQISNCDRPLPHTLYHQPYYDPYSTILALFKRLSIVAVYRLDGLSTSPSIP